MDMVGKVLLFCSRGGEASSMQRDSLGGPFAARQGASRFQTLVCLKVLVPAPPSPCLLLSLSLRCPALCDKFNIT